MRFALVLFVLLVAFFANVELVSALASPIRVVTFDSNRSPQGLFDVHSEPLYTNAGSSNIIESLEDLSKFGGEGAVVSCGVEFLPTVEEILPGSLVDEKGILLTDVFFGPLLNWELSSAEADELAKFVEAGGVVFVAGSTSISGPGYNPLFESLNISDRWLGINVYNPPTYFSSPHYTITETVLGPFGEVNTLEHRSYKWLDRHDLVGVFRDVPDFSLPYVVAEKRFGEGYLVVSSGQIYSNVFTENENDNLEYFLNLFAMGCKQQENTAVVLDVPSLKQYEAPWGGEEYDSAVANNLGCGVTIGDCGCALTSAAMVMGYYGVNIVQNGLAMNPGAVNNYFSERNWYSKGNFNWWLIDNYTAPFDEINSVKLDQPVREDFDEDKVRKYIDNGVPVILKVYSSSVPQHFVVVKGYDDEGLIIDDPAYLDIEGHTYLLDRGYFLYGGGRGTMIHYDVAHTDYSSFEAVSLSDLVIKKDNQIVGNYYTDGEGNYLGKEIHIVDVQLPNDGVYSIELALDNGGECDTRVYSSNNLGSVLWKDLNVCVTNVKYKSGEGLSYELEIDVRLASENNLVNGVSHSVFPAVILGSKTTDVGEVNFDTVDFEGAKPFWTGKRRWFRDVNKDGYMDAIMFFEREKMDNDFGGGEVCLTGELTSGFGFWGCDEVKTIPR